MKEKREYEVYEKTLELANRYREKKNYFI